MVDVEKKIKSSEALALKILNQFSSTIKVFLITFTDQANEKS